MSNPQPALDRPWRRPGAARYAATHLRGILRPPVTVYPAPPELIRDHDLAVTMRGGVILRANVYRPRHEGRYPALISAHPYGKDDLPTRTRRGWRFSRQYRIMRQPCPVRFSELTSWEAPDPAWWAERGYVVVNADTRGAGTSDGVGTLMSDREGEDVYDLIEWAAAQPWCDGNVGMLGVSYLAISQYKAAALRPPSLRAICPWEGFTDAYRDLFTPGGMVERGFSRIWQAAMKRVRLTEDIGKERRRHPLRDEWWQAHVPDLSRIEVPMLVCASFSDNALHGRGSFRAFAQTGSKDRFVYTHRGGKWATFYGQAARSAQLAFFDRYLKGDDVPQPPTVRLEVRDRGDAIAEVRAEQEWPLARTVWRDLFLAPGGTLSDTPPADPGQLTFDTRRHAAAFTLAVGAELELTGPMALHLWVSVDRGDDLGLFVGVEKRVCNRPVWFEGSYGFGRDRVATGWQRASLRELDDDASTPFLPVHTFRQRQPLAPGQIVPLQIALGPSATLFHPGETLRLLIAGRSLAPHNPLTGSFPASWRPTPRARATLHWGPERLALLRVPAIPGV